MNLRTTIILAALVVVGGLAWFFFPGPAADEVTSPSLRFLEKDLRQGSITRIELHGSNRKVVLDRAGEEEWSLPGKWPVRTNEAKELERTLTELRSRFAPIAAEARTFKEYGLDPASLIVKVTVAGKEHTLALGEKPAETNTFARPTFVRVDDQKEIVRLAPGLIAALDRPAEYYQQRRLFPSERVARDADAGEKVEQVAAKLLSVKSPEGTYELTKSGDTWNIGEPVKDKMDPDKLRTVLSAFQDIWAERFVDSKGKKLEDFGLAQPETVLSVTRPSGSVVKLLVGKESEMKFRKVPKPPMPQQPFMPPKQDFDLVQEQYRVAKLENNEQIFEIKADKLKEVSLNLNALRDPQLARFRTENVKRLEVHKDDQHLVFVKDKDKWRFEKPTAEDAENGPVNELLDKLSGLQARDKDLLDKADLKALGLEKPAARIKITLEEEKGDKDNKTKTTRDIAFELGTKEKEKDKLYVKVEGWPRVNAVDDAVLKLVQRPVVAYRNRKVIDVAAADLGKLEIQRGAESYTFQQEKGTWKLTAPVQAEVDSGKVSRLAGDLARLEVADFVTSAPKAEDLDKVYGLTKPALTAKLSFTDEKKPAKTLVLGKAKGDKEFYGRVDDGPVFLLKKDTRDELDRDSLAYMPLEVLPGLRDKIREVAITKDAQEYRLVKEDKNWKLRGAVDAPAAEQVAEPLFDELENLRATRYVAHDAKELNKFGLDKPYLTLRILPAKKEDAEQVLIIGKTVETDAKAEPSKSKADKAKGEDKEVGRYAKLGKSPAIFVLPERSVKPLDHAALDFLDKKLLALDSKAIQKIRSEGTPAYTLQQKKDAWEVTDSPAPAFTAEEDAVQSLLRPWSNLTAERIAAYGSKIDWAAYGLDKPARTVTVTVAADKDKTAEHKVALGKETDKGQRFARVDQQDQVAILDAATVSGLSSTHLDFVSTRLLKFDLDTVNSVSRQMSGGDLELVKRDETWHFAKPSDKPADDPTVGELLEKMFRLRAQRIAAYPAKDLATYGLDKPAAVVTLKLTDFQGRTVEHVIKVGKPVDDKKEERYALVDKGEAVAVLGADLSKQLVAPPLSFADRNLPGFTSADKAVQERPGRKVAFTRGEPAWTMIEPVKAEAEDSELDELMKSLRRLRAEEIVADKGADLKQHGLEKPEVQWHFFSGDKEVMHLLVGAKDKEGRRYAKLGKDDRVFTLGAKLSERVTEEYRSRKPWPSLDAAQVEKLSYKGPTSFTLSKRDGDWNVLANLEAKVSAKQVTDTLDALAGLKAVRYVADAKADLKLYGLEPPVWTIEAEMPSGKRTLHVGRAEGDSQRLYATVPGSDAVFVIGAGEAQRIVRPLVGFVEKK